MANTIDAFLERLTGAAGDFNKAKVSELSALDAVYLDVKPEVARQGQTIRINFPDVGAFTDQGAGDWSPEDVNPGFVDVPFGQRPGKAILIRDFEQFQTSTDIIDQFIDPNFKRAQEYANAQVFNLVNTTNFPTYPAIATAPGSFDIGSARLAWNLLIRNKVPLRAGDATILYHPDLHANTLTDKDWYQESLVSAVIARGTRQDAAGPDSDSNQAFKFARRFDQQAPSALSSNLTGTVAGTAGTTAVTGTSTVFTTQAPVGTWVQVAGDTNQYQVKTVTDDTHIVLAQALATTPSGATYKRLTYTSVAMHRYAIALAVRPLELVNDGHVRSRLMMLKGLPMRLMLSYQHLKSGWLMTLDYGMVTRTIRPDFGVVVTS